MGGAIKAQLAEDIRRLGSASEVVQAIRNQYGSEERSMLTEVSQSDISEGKRPLPTSASKVPSRSSGDTSDMGQCVDMDSSMLKNVSKTPPRHGAFATVATSGQSGDGSGGTVRTSASAMQSFMLKTPPRLTGSVTVPASDCKQATSFVIATPGDTETEGSFIDDMLGQLRNDVDSVQSNIVKLRSQYRPASTPDAPGTLGIGRSPSRSCQAVVRSGSACLPVAVGIGKRP